MTIIKASEVRKGDKLRVTVQHVSDMTLIREGVADIKSTFDWRTKSGAWFYADSEDAVIELLERPKTAEDILKERRDALSRWMSATGLNYEDRTSPFKQAIDKIIELEDKLAKKEEEFVL